MADIAREYPEWDKLEIPVPKLPRYKRQHSLSPRRDTSVTPRFRSLPLELPSLSPGFSRQPFRMRSLTRSRSPSPPPPPQSGEVEEPKGYSIAYSLGIALLLMTVAGVMSE